MYRIPVRKGENMKTYVITNLKGGVGKTTTTVNLSYSMSLLGKNILVVDADPQSNTSSFFIRPDYGRYTIRDVYMNPGSICRMVYRTKYHNIDILKGSTDLKESDVAGEMTLAESLNLVSDKYDVCIIDTRPAFEAITRSAIYAADVIVTPVLLDKFCRDNLLLVEDLLNETKMDGQGVNAVWKIFANRVENKRSQRNIYADMAGKHMWPILDNCVSKCAAVENALELYKPVIKHRSKCSAASDYMELARELLGV